MTTQHESSSAIELNERSARNVDLDHVMLAENGDQPVRYQQLKRTDGGLHAWKVLIAAFFFEALLWGFPVCFGVFQEHYSHVPSLANQNVALIGTVAQGLVYLGAPLAAALTKRFPKYQRHMIWLGWACCIIALGTGSLSSRLEGLVLTQGLLYGIGFLVLYWPIMSMVNEWWVVRSGFAFGFIWAAAGASGAVLPFVFQALLARYGYALTLRGTAIAMLALTGPLIPFCKPRLPPAESSTLASMDWSFRSNLRFWIYTLATTLQGFGLFFPSIFLASYAADLGLQPKIGALLLSLLALSQFMGYLTIGFLSDKGYRFLPVSALCILCTLAAALSAFLLWGFSTSLAPLVGFSLVFGFFGYGFSAMRSGMAKQITKDPNTVMALQSILNGSLGWGNILVGPISAQLLRSSGGVAKYESLVYFTGSCMLGSAAVLVIGPVLRWVKPSI